MEIIFHYNETDFTKFPETYKGNPGDRQAIDELIAFTKDDVYIDNMLIFLYDDDNMEVTINLIDYLNPTEQIEAKNRLLEITDLLSKGGREHVTIAKDDLVYIDEDGDLRSKFPLSFIGITGQIPKDSKIPKDIDFEFLRNPNNTMFSAQYMIANKSYSAIEPIK